MPLTGSQRLVYKISASGSKNGGQQLWPLIFLIALVIGIQERHANHVSRKNPGPRPDVLPLHLP
jgi:hypothetical protein